MDKNKWIDDVMNSTDGMSRATPRDGLLRKIEQRMEEGVIYAKQVPMRTVSLAAASIVLLVAVNIALLNTRPVSGKSQKNTPIETVVEYYGLNEEPLNY